MLTDLSTLIKFSVKYINIVLKTNTKFRFRKLYLVGNLVVYGVRENSRSKKFPEWYFGGITKDPDLDQGQWGLCAIKPSKNKKKILDFIGLSLQDYSLREEYLKDELEKRKAE